MRIARQISLFLLVILPITIYFITKEDPAPEIKSKDVELSTDAKRLLEMVEIKGESEAYLYLLGIMAAPEDDPIEVGRKLLAEYRKEEQDSKYKVQEYPESKQIKIPKDGLYCDFTKKCRHSLFKQDYNIDEIIAANKIIIDRVKKFHSYDEFSIMTLPIVETERFPDYRAVFAYGKIKRLKALDRVKKGKTEKAINQLMADIEVYRRQIIIQKDMVGKIIYAILIKEDLDLISMILSSSTEPVNIKKIRNLSEEKKSYSYIFARYFYSQFLIYKNWDGLDENHIYGVDIMAGVIRDRGEKLLFLPNTAINSAVDEYLSLIKLEKSTTREFARAVAQDYDIIRSGTLSGRALYKKILAVCNSKEFITNSHIESCAVSKYLIPKPPNQYLSDIMDLDATISVFNQLYVEKKPISEIKNPYYPDKFVYKKDGEIYFDGPFKDKRILRRLTIEKL